MHSTSRSSLTLMYLNVDVVDNDIILISCITACDQFEMHVYSE